MGDFVLVPREPTPEMLKAGVGRKSSFNLSADAKACWSAMLAALSTKEQGDGLATAITEAVRSGRALQAGASEPGISIREALEQAAATADLHDRTGHAGNAILALRDRIAPLAAPPTAR